MPESTADCNKIGHLGGNPGRDEHALIIALMLVKQAAVGGDDAAKSIGSNRDALVLDRGECASHFDEADITASPEPSTDRSRSES